MDDSCTDTVAPMGCIGLELNTVITRPIKEHQLVNSTLFFQWICVVDVWICIQLIECKNGGCSLTIPFKAAVIVSTRRTTSSYTKQVLLLGVGYKIGLDKLISIEIDHRRPANIGDASKNTFEFTIPF